MANLFHGFIYPQLVSIGRKRKEYQEAHSQTNGTHCNGIKSLDIEFRMRGPIMKQ